MTEKMGIAKRITEVRKKLQLRQHELAEVMGVSRALIGRYEKGDVPTNITSFGTLCHTFGIDAHWLLTGDGTMLRPANISKVASTNAEIVNLKAENERLHQLVDSYKTANEVSMLQQLGLEDVALYADRGGQATAWSILQVLADNYPNTQSVEAIELALVKHDVALSRMALKAELRLLEKRGLVRMDIVGQTPVYLFIRPIAELHATEIADGSQVVREAIKTLVRRILPVVDRHPERGHIITSLSSVPAGEAQALVEMVVEAVRAIWSGAASESGDDTVALVFGISSIEKPTGEAT